MVVARSGHESVEAVAICATMCGAHRNTKNCKGVMQAGIVELGQFLHQALLE